MISCTKCQEKEVRQRKTQRERRIVRLNLTRKSQTRQSLQRKRKILVLIPYEGELLVRGGVSATRDPTSGNHSPKAQKNPTDLYCKSADVKRDPPV